jgi:Fe-S cluster assembly protein SufD
LPKVALLQAQDAESALERFAAARSRREKPSRYWKYDLEGTAVVDRELVRGQGSVILEAPKSRAIVCDLETAQREHVSLLEPAFGSAIQSDQKFAQLTLAYGGDLGAFVYVPADCSVDEPIVVHYRCGDGESIFPRTLVLLERGARACVIERIEAGAVSFICGITEIVTQESADVRHASVQNVPTDTRVISTRTALPGRDSRVTWSSAELGGALAVSDIALTIDQPGVEGQIAVLFFPRGNEHVDVLSSVDHRVGDSSSRTLVKSAGTGAGQGRYLGNIRIARDAQRTDAALKDDALLLSARAHIDSIPALEIAANDVKAYHGATVGAVDPEQIFYIESRGVERTLAERMVALGFFEPVLEYFPTERLREELRSALEAKID